MTSSLDCPGDGICGVRECDACPFGVRLVINDFKGKLTGSLPEYAAPRTFEELRAIRGESPIMDMASI